MGVISGMFKTAAVSLLGAAMLLAPAGAQERTVIRFLHNDADPPSVQFFNKVIQDFEAANPDIKVEMELASSDARLQKILASAITKTLPDIFKVVTLENYAFVRRGLVSPVDDLIDKVGRQDYQPESLVAINGHYYAVPYAMGLLNTLFYRKDKLQAAGLTPPSTLTDMLNAALKTNTGGDFGMVFGANANRGAVVFFSSLLWSFGGSYFDKDLRVTFNTPEVVAALKYIGDIAKGAPPGIGGYSNADIVNGFLSRKAAMAMGSSRIASEAAKTDLIDVTGAMAMPAGPGGASVTVASTDAYALASPEFGGKHQEQAKKFLAYLQTGDRPKLFALTAFPAIVPPRMSVQQEVLTAGAATNPKVASLVKDVFRSAIGSVDFATEAGFKIVNGKVVLSGVENPYIGPIIERFIPALAAQRVIFQGEDPKAAAAWGQGEMERIVQELKSASK